LLARKIIAPLHISSLVIVTHLPSLLIVIKPLYTLFLQVVGETLEGTFAPLALLGSYWLLHCALPRLLGVSFLEPTARGSSKISSPQPSRLPRLTAQQSTAFCLLRDQFCAEFHAAFPNNNTSDLFTEVPDYQACHTVLIPDYTLPIQNRPPRLSIANSSSPSSPSSPPSSPLTPIPQTPPIVSMAANVANMPARGHPTALKFCLISCAS
jgi:hypothetical protein